MPAANPFVVVGTGLAGAKAAETLRGEGFDGPLVLVGAEAERPYERPPLSKTYLLGEAERGQAFVHGEDWYAGHDVELRSGVRATRLDPAAHRGMSVVGVRARGTRTTTSDLHGLLRVDPRARQEFFALCRSGG